MLSGRTGEAETGVSEYLQKYRIAVAAHRVEGLDTRQVEVPSVDRRFDAAHIHHEERTMIALNHGNTCSTS